MITKPILAMYLFLLLGLITLIGGFYAKEAWVITAICSIASYLIYTVNNENKGI